MSEIAGYTSPNPAYTVAAISADKEAMLASIEALVKTRRDEHVGAQWKFHNSMDGGRDAVGVQFGQDSNEYQSVGRKKKSEYKNRKVAPKTESG